MSTDPYMVQLAKEYRTAREALLSHRGNRFQHRAVVRVDSARYHGLGAVAIDSECPPDQVPVRLCNGNVWWYPIEDVTPSDEPMPRELRHAVLTNAGINHA